MSSELSKQEYLKRYLEKEKDSDRKRKKKPKKKVHVSSLKIVDEDISLKSLNFGDKVEEDEDDEKPVVAEVIDERPLEDKIKELYESSRWKKIDNESSRTNSVAELRDNDNKPNSVSLKENSSYEKDQSNSRRFRHDSDSDLSPPRIQDRIGRKRNDSSVLSPQRNQKRNLSDSDISPPRSHKQRRSNKHDSDSDISPPRSHRQRKSNNKHDSDSDISPPRHQFPQGRAFPDKFNRSAITKSKRHDSDSDISLPRHQVTSTSSSQKVHMSKKYNPDRDISSPNHINLSKSKTQRKNSSGRHDSDSDDSLLKNKIHLLSRLKDESRSSFDNKERHSDSDLSPPRSTAELSNKDKTKKLGKTLSGLKAGLQNSKTLQKEILELREREKNQLNTLDDEVSGKNASTIIRDRKTGLKRDLNQEQQAKSEENKRTKEYQQKYAQWGKGIEQTLEKKDKFMDDLYEMSKPLARYQDDKDLDERLKSVIHDEDPMSEYIKKKRQKDTPSKYPVYTGPSPPNRFRILPGCRWDGVDRSNGFESTYFAKVNKSKAVETEAYLWSVQDM